MSPIASLQKTMPAIPTFLFPGSTLQAHIVYQNDYLFPKEGFGQEGEAWRRAVAFFAGEAVEPEAEPVYEHRRALETFQAERQH